MLVVGIDPGMKGAIALLDGSRLVIHDMPVIPAPTGKTVLELDSLGKILRPDVDAICPERCFAVLEKVSPRPGEGVSSSFRFGQGYGSIEMALVGHGWERNYVTPTVWKKYFGLSQDKGASRALAIQRFPAHADLFKRVKDDGRAEAALLTLYALEVLIPKQNR